MDFGTNAVNYSTLHSIFCFIRRNKFEFLFATKL